jgi:hypothetical protein
VRGTVPLGGQISDTTRNTVDGGIQASRLGCDIWRLPITNSIPRAHEVYELHPLTNDVTQTVNLFVPTYQSGAGHDTINAPIDSDVFNYHVTPKMVPRNDLLTLVVVVHEGDNSTLSKRMSTKSPKSLIDKINVGSLTSCDKSSGSGQTFYQLTKQKFSELCNAYPNGYHLGGMDISENVDALVRSYSSGSREFISVEKLAALAGMQSTHKVFSRIFGGEGSPQVDDTFHQMRTANGLAIYFKLALASEYAHHPPLSQGFYDCGTHGVQIHHVYLELLNRAFGKRGLFVGGRRTMTHTGSLSYVGPRKTDNQRQPSGAEGPREPGVPLEKRFCYHRKHMDHLYLPFAQGLVNFIVGTTSQAASFIYSHLSVLYPVSNSAQYRNKFCPRGILAIDFSSSCHTDRNDDQAFCYQDITTRLREVCKKLKHLCQGEVTTSILAYQQATEALKHVLWWGVCLPTTCCYQYISQRNDVVVYQWFICPGLGTAHRIRNYWVHLFLGSTFSHCTSAPIYVVNGRAYFGSCPTCVMFSWGAN